MYGPRRRPRRGARRPDDHRADRRDHPAVRHLRLRLGPVALPRHRRRSTGRPRWATSTSAIVEEVGGEVTTVKPGQFVVGSFFASDNTCEICRAGYQTSCVAPRAGRCRSAPRPSCLRVPLADGTLVATPGHPRRRPDAQLLAASDVLGTGWFGAVAAEAGPGKTVAVVGDGAVGLLGVLAAKQLGAERIIAMSRHATGRSWPASSAPPTSSPSAATRAWPRSRSSPTGSARTR